jgi:hypothetical protein
VELRQTVIKFSDGSEVAGSELFLLLKNSKMKFKEYKAEKRSLDGTIHKKKFGIKFTVNLTFLDYTRPEEIFLEFVESIGKEISDIVERENGLESSVCLYNNVMSSNKTKLIDVLNLSYDGEIGTFQVTYETFA